jgi:CO dehydrogenase maturation factor
MKISVCGKGGSGESSVPILPANGSRDRGCQVLVVDSDESKSGLYRMLGLDTPAVPLIELVEGKKRVQGQMKSGLSRGESEEQMRVLTQDNMSTEDLSYPHVLQKDGIGLVFIGKILQSMEGCACPMGVLGPEFLNKLRLKDKEIAIVDTEAGVG